MGVCVCVCVNVCVCVCVCVGCVQEGFYECICKKVQLCVQWVCMGVCRTFKGLGVYVSVYRYYLIRGIPDPIAGMESNCDKWSCA